MSSTVHDFPSEIFLLVLDLLSSFDLDGFASTRKRWPAVAAKRLAEHARLKKKYDKASSDCIAD